MFREAIGRRAFVYERISVWVYRLVECHRFGVRGM